MPKDSVSYQIAQNTIDGRRAELNQMGYVDSEENPIEKNLISPPSVHVDWWWTDKTSLREVDANNPERSP